MGQFPDPGADPMSEDERQEFVCSDAEAPVLKEAFKAERTAFRLKRELQQLDIQGPEPDSSREPLAEVRCGGKVIDV